MLKHWIWLATRKGISERNICRVLRHFGSAETAYGATREQYLHIEGLRVPESLLDKDLSSAEQILRQCEEKNIRVIAMCDTAYPQRLAHVEDAPIVLYCRGNLWNLNAPMVGVVGTRAASVYGLYQSKRIAFGLARCGCIVVSGGAKGVDTHAMRGALLGGGATVAVLGCGVDVVYPAENKQLFRDVEANGCLLSEYPPGTPPHRYRFPRRNRIISGLSLGVLVTEAPEKSGAMITAEDALEQGRDIFVLPANVGVSSFGGNLKLLREGAAPVGCAWDIVQEYREQYPEILKENHDEFTENVQKEPAIQTVDAKKVIDNQKNKAYIDLKDMEVSLTEAEKTVARLLSGGAVHMDVLTEKLQTSASRLLPLMTRLQIKGIVCQTSSGVYELAEK